MSDAEIRTQWEQFLEPAMNPRHSYQALYAPHLEGQLVLEVGSGLGIDALFFAQKGARWHCVDIAPENLEVVRRVFAAFDLELDGTTLLTDLSSLDDAPDDVDVIFCSGSMLHAPFAFTRVETRALCTHLAPGGRWLELAYPRSRWVREGSPAFDQWGELTDGPGTQWAEWYDLDKIRERFAPIPVSPVIAFDFAGGDFNWFDLIIDEPPSEVGLVHEPLVVDIEACIVRTHAGADAAIIPGASPQLDITGSPTMWSYAVDISTDDVCRAAGLTDDVTTISLAIDLTVHDGIVGVLPVDRHGDGLGEQFAAEAHRMRSDGPTTVFIDRADRARSAVVLRTSGGSGGTMRCTVSAIRIYPA